MLLVANEVGRPFRLLPAGKEDQGEISSKATGIVSSNKLKKSKPLKTKSKGFTNQTNDFRLFPAGKEDQDEISCKSRVY